MKTLRSHEIDAIFMIAAIASAMIVLAAIIFVCGEAERVRKIFKKRPLFA